MIVALRSSSSYLVDCLRIIVFSSLLFFMDITWHKDSIGECFKRFRYFLFFMNMWRFGQTTIDQSLWLVHELLESYKWCYVVTLWCSISPRCPFLVCKRHFGRCFTNGSLNLSFVHLIFEIFKPIWKYMVLAQFGMLWCTLVQNLGLFGQC